MQLSKAIDGYWLDKKREFSKNTCRNYSYVFAYFLAFVGDIEFDAIATKDIRRFLNCLADDRNYSKRSIHDAWIPLSSLWTWAEIELGTIHVINKFMQLFTYAYYLFGAIALAFLAMKFAFEQMRSNSGLLDVVKAWRFQLKTMKGFSWVKKTKHGKDH